MVLRPIHHLTRWIFPCAVLFSSPVYCNVSYHGEFQLQLRSFSKSPDYFTDDSIRHLQSSVMIEPEWLWEGESTLLNFKSFLRVDSHDGNRTHNDIRELQWLHYWQDYEITVGVGKVFWGVTESQHVVDVINQTDAIEGLDGEDKLGQPMVQFKAIKEYGTFEAFVLPYFRKRTFPGFNGRFRPPLAIAEKAVYQSSKGNKHVDYAIRYSHSIDDWDMALSYFQGTDREPIFQLMPDEILPYYAQMRQTGLELQTVQGDWLWKMEARYRDSAIDHGATTMGFEYSQIGILDRAWDLGWIVEYSFDSRRDALNQNDLFVGWRLALNDVDGNTFLAGISQDLERQEYAAKLEASGRINNHWKWQIDAWAFSSDSPISPVYFIRNDDVLELSLSYFF